MTKRDDEIEKRAEVLLDTKEIALLVIEAQQKKEYRPVAVGIITDPNDRLLFVNSAKNRDDWGFPQGGIEQGEDAVAALFRELDEELSVYLADRSSVSYLGTEDMDAEPGRLDKRGWSKGKRYLFFKVAIQEKERLEPDPSEIADFTWAEPHEAAKVMATTRQEKRELLMRFIGKVVTDRK